jgi:hypothetical protein
MNYIKLLKELEELTKWNDHTNARLTLVNALISFIDNKIDAGLKTYDPNFKPVKLDGLLLLRKSYDLVRKQQAFDGYLKKESSNLRDEADDILYMIATKLHPIQAPTLLGAL